MATEEIKSLKQKLAVSVNARQSLERTYEKQFSTLTNLIARLSKVCSGIDIELGGKLNKLKAHLAKNTDLDKIKPLIDELIELLNQHETHIAQNIKGAQQSLTNAGKQLQKAKGLPDDLRRNLRSTLGEIAQPQGSITHLLPHLSDLISFYQHVFSLKQDENGANNTSEDHAKKAKLQRQISAQLLNVLNNVSFSGESANKIDKIRAKLSKPVDYEIITKLCVEITRLTVESITEERQSAQTFLFSLNDALNSVHNAVASSLLGNKKINASKQLLNEKIKQDITHISNEVAKATSLDSLKLEITKSLDGIVGSLNDKESLEMEENKLLADNLHQMEIQLKELEAEAEVYKTKLSEQRFKSLQDALTKLPNRASLDERMELEYRKWMRYNHDLCIAVADIDHFKKINDTLGHSVGDKVLQIVAQALKKPLRETDYIARYGGEEFVMIFPTTNLKVMQPKLDAIRQQVETIPFKFKNSNLKVTISIGVTQLQATDQPQTAFDRADEALYQAKNSGRNKVIIKK